MARASLLLATAALLLSLTVALAIKDPCSGAPLKGASIYSFSNGWYMSLYQNDEYPVGGNKVVPFSNVYISDFGYPISRQASANGPFKCFSGSVAGGVAAVTCSLPGDLCTVNYEDWFSPPDCVPATITVTASGKGVKSSTYASTYKYTSFDTTPPTTSGGTYKSDGFACSKAPCAFTVTVSKRDSPADVLESFTSGDFFFGTTWSRPRFCF